MLTLIATWFASNWRWAVPAIVIAGLALTVKVDGMRIASLHREKDTLTAKAFDLANEVDALKGAIERGETVQKHAAAVAAAAAQTKGDIDEAINLAPADGPVLPVLGDTIRRVSRHPRAGAGGQNHASGKPAGLPAASGLSGRRDDAKGRGALRQ